MKLIKFFSLLCVFQAGIVQAASATVLPKFAVGIKSPKTLSISLQNGPYSKKYSNTECIDFTLRPSRKKVGFLCSTNDQRLLDDIGVSVVEDNSAPKIPLKPNQNLVVSTGMSQYPMGPFVIDQLSAYSSIVDCDLYNGPVYRATGSCHITIASDNSGKFFYSNFILENHVTQRRFVSVSDIKTIWHSLAYTLKKQ